MTIAAKFEIEYLQYLGTDGQPVAELPPAFRDPRALLPLFRQMLFVDVFSPRSREDGPEFMRGVLPREVLLYWGGDERGNDFAGPKNDYPWCVPISTQCLMAAGAALSFKLRRQQRIAVACCGDGGSSKAEFYAALNS